jgi:rhodanese-related sulfurtransferase
MNKTIREKFQELFGRQNLPPVITEDSSLHEIAVQYPSMYDFIERKYGVKIDADEKTLSLKTFVERFGLPPAQVLFMEIQISVRSQIVKSISALEAKYLLEKKPTPQLLDVREDWEIQICRLPNSEVLGPQKLDEILNQWPRDTPILLYCHFGVRSMDAATFLTDRGFTKVYTLKGGIDAWSVEVDSKIPRYENAWC